MSRALSLKRLDRIIGPLFCRLLRGKPSSSPPPVIPKQIERLLIIRPGGIGDMLLLLPSIAAVRENAPGMIIDVVCESRNAEVLRLAKIGVTPICYDQSPFKTIAHLRNHSYDVVIDTEQFHNFSAVFTALTRSPIRIGFNINPVRNPLYSHIVNYDVAGCETDQFQSLCQHIPHAPFHDFSGILKEKICMDCQAQMDIPDSPYAVIHAGGSSPDKHWPSERYADLIESLAKKGFASILTGDKTDIHRAGEIIGCTRNANVTDITNKYTLEENAHICSKAALFVGPDSGLAHLSVALGTPTVALFGSSDPEKWSHPGCATYRAVRRAQACSPCAIFGYIKPCRHYSCINDITLNDVSLAIDTVIHK